MSLVKFNEARTLPTIFSDFFDNGFFNNEFFTTPLTKWIPATNVKETAKDFQVEVAVPGFKKDDFKVKVEDEVLMIEAETREEKNEENERYTRKEFRTTSFNRSFRMPKEVMSDKVDAKYENGILRIVLPKKTETKVLNTKEIKVS